MALFKLKYMFKRRIKLSARNQYSGKNRYWKKYAMAIHSRRMKILLDKLMLAH